MMLELELAWEWLSPGGVIFVDDIGWNDAVDILTKVREPTHGLVTPGVAYMTN